MHTITIGSKFEEMTEVESLIDKVCAELNWGDENYGNVLIAVTEAVNNAIIHGNQKQGERKVKVEAKREQNAIIFSVTDEGKGFDFGSIPDPTAPENIEKPDGRGIFLMKSLSDGVEFENGGSKVNIAFSAQ